MTENHARSLLASLQHAASLLDSCDEALSSAASTDPFARFDDPLTGPEERVARDYLRRLRQQLQAAVRWLGLEPSRRRVGTRHALATTLLFLDDTFEEMRAARLAGYGPLSPDTAASIDATATALQALAAEFSRFLHGATADEIEAQAAALAAVHPEAAPLRRLAHIVAAYGLSDLRPGLTSLLSRLQDASFDVAIIGHVSSGKSSLLNSLVGVPLLPTGVLPVTSFPTRVRHGERAGVHVTYADGREEHVRVDRLADFVSEEGNPGNQKRLTRLLVVHPSDRLPAGVTFVDTPGLGAVSTRSELETYAYLPRCDHAVLLIDGARPPGVDDIAVLRFLRDSGISSSVLLSKADLLSVPDRDRVVAFLATTLQRALGRPVAIRPVSSAHVQHDLLERWIDEEVVPLGVTAATRRERDIARRTRELCGRALRLLSPEHAAPRTSARAPLAQEEASRLRTLDAEIDRLSRKWSSLIDQRDALVQRAHEVALELLSASPSPDRRERWRSESTAIPQCLVEPLLLDLRTCIQSVAEADARTDGLPRGLPLPDLPPLPDASDVPGWARISRVLTRGWLRDHVLAAWTPQLEGAMDAYLAVLSRWARDAFASLRMAVGARLQATQPEGASINTRVAPESPSFADDVSWLTQAAGQEGDANPPDEVSPRSH